MQVYIWISHFSLTKCSLVTFSYITIFSPAYNDNFVIFLRFIHVLYKV